MTAPSRVCLLGLGEVGTILADDLPARSVTLSAWDLLFSEPDSGPSRAASGRRVRAGSDARDAVRDAELVISAVTAAETVAAARSVAGVLLPGAHYLDLNSASPESKREAARVVEGGGGRYVEAAVMAPFPPSRMGAAILLGGEHAEAFLKVARELGFAGARFFSDECGRASAVKMCRSVVVKGLEALLTESLVTARRHRVEGDVLESLGNVVAEADWPALARYMISRSLEHGARRAEEMREVAKTVAEAGLAPLVSAACADRQQWASRHAEVGREPDLGRMLDAIRSRLEGPRETSTTR